MSRWTLGLFLALGLATVGSGIALVYVKYLTHRAFTELQALTTQRHQLEEEWTMLQLEEAALSTHPRIEQIARTRLHMYFPRPIDTKTIRPEDRR